MDKRQAVFNNYEVPDPPRIKKVLNFIHKYFPNIEGKTVLELGIAKGGLADILSKEGAECYGIDINPRSLPGIKIIQANLNEQLPDMGKKFDIIFAGEVIEHLFDDSAIVKSCNTLLRPGGLFIATVPNIAFSPNRLLLLLGKMPVFACLPCHYHVYTKNSFVKLLTIAGFSILKVSSSHIAFSTRRNRFGKIFELAGDYLPSFGANLIVCSTKLN